MNFLQNIYKQAALKHKYVFCRFCRIVIDGANHSPPVCLTCTLMEDRCKYNSAYFSTNGTYYRLSCSGTTLDIPRFPSEVLNIP